MNVEQPFPFEAEVTAKRSPFANWLVKRRWFMLGVVVPTLIAVLYYGFIASDVYISESRFVIKSPDQKRSQTSTLANLIQTTGLSAGQEQTNEVLAYVRSRDALKSLEKDVGIREQFANSGADILSRFPGPLSQNTFEDLFRYYGNMVDARLDSDTGLAVIKVKAFNAQDAYTINAKLLNLSEELVNRLNSRAQTNGIAEAQKQVDLATIKAKETRIALAKYRNAQSLIDPERQAVGVLEISSGLVAQRAALQAQLEQMQRVTPGNPSLPALQNRIASISSQIALQDGRVVGSNSGIASKLGGYENLLVEQEFATQRLNAANTALARASAEAVSQQFYLERVVEPNVPDEPLLPKRFLDVLVIAACALCLYVIGWMFMVGILEHSTKE